MSTSMETLDVGLASDVKLACRRNGVTPEQLKKLCEGDLMAQCARLADGTHKIVPVGAVIANMKFSVTKRLDPEAFIGKGRKFAERHGTSKAITEIDLARITLVNPLKEEDRGSIKGEERLVRLLGDGKIHLGADHFLACWENRQFLPEEWKKFVITFDDDVLLGPSGSRYVLCLGWGGSEWDWDYNWLGSGFSARCRSVSL